MIIGEYQNRIGEKKRVALPKKFREELGDEIIVTRGYENCLVVVNKGMWEKIGSEVMNGSFINSKVRDTSRFLIGSASEVTLDGQGRFVIPQPLFDHAQLEDEIVFIGLVNWIEIWSKKAWEKKLEQLQSNSSEIADEISQMNKQ
jgi:MraZ protein